MDRDEIEQLVEELVEEKTRQIIGQFDILPDAVKQRHVGEGIRFIRFGLAADRATSGEQKGAVYFATDTDTLGIWNGSAWVEEVLT